ncbi:Phospholipase A(2) [Meloidogyne graminicola]|uniref:Phospholipase A(2) n=1 Tax=Meloidogyne graminicola TaxID=189291 RepID=A0A8S9ZNL1_9BILA|nr:Phospholipase A(2) [Meloidogyne graminicola]
MCKIFKILFLFIFKFIFINGEIIPSAEECDKLMKNGGTYDNYGCYCTGRTRSNTKPVDEIDNCCFNLQNCLLPLYMKGTCNKILSANYYFFNNDTCVTYYERCTHANECGIGLCKCFKEYTGCLIQLPIPNIRKLCTNTVLISSKTIRTTKNSLQSAFALFSTSITSYMYKQ